MQRCLMSWVKSVGVKQGSGPGHGVTHMAYSQVKKPPWPPDALRGATRTL